MKTTTDNIADQALIWLAEARANRIMMKSVGSLEKKMALAHEGFRLIFAAEALLEMKQKTNENS